MQNPTCSKCGGPLGHVKWRFCKECAQIYMRERDGRSFGPAAPRLKGRTPAERLAANSKHMPNGCVLWCAGKNGNYGVMRVGRKTARTHRVAWELKNGPIPTGRLVLHNCPGGDNPLCINPDHLWLGTDADNQADCIAKGRRPTRYRWKSKPAAMTAADIGLEQFQSSSRETIAADIRENGT